jgi:hypothetical protein
MLIKLLWNSRIKTTKRRFDPVHSHSYTAESSTIESLFQKKGYEGSFRIGIGATAQTAYQVAQALKAAQAAIDKINKDTADKE